MKPGTLCFATLLLGVLGPGATAANAQPNAPAASAPSEMPPEAPLAPPTPPAETPGLAADTPAPAPATAAPPAATPAEPSAPPRVELPPSPPAASWLANSLKIETANSSIKFGLLAQPQFESAGAAVGSGMSNNLFIRRIRILIGGTLFGNLEYFVDTDSPNLFKAVPDGVRTTSAMVIQDAFATYKILKDVVKVDAGYMLPPLAHNAVQGAATLYGLDYFTNSFLHNTVFGNAVAPVGRDLGVQLRGLPLDGRLEYRIGVFQGKRNPANVAPPATAGGPNGPVIDVAGRNAFRFVGRLQVNLLDPETGFFYSGTYLGAKRILSVGGSYDFQYTHSWSDSYRYWAVDGFLDLPAGPGAVTAQVNLAQWNGGSLVQLTERTALMGEAGYRIADIQLNPIVRIENLWVPGSNGAADTTETRYGGGLAFWGHGHSSSLKAFYMRVHPTTAGQQDYNLVNLQWQIYFF